MREMVRGVLYVECCSRTAKKQEEREGPKPDPLEMPRGALLADFGR